MMFRTSTISITIKQGLTKLPVVHDSFVLEKAKGGLGPLMQLGLCQMRMPVLDFYGEIDKVVSSIFTQSDQTFLPCFPCVGDSENENLTSPQRELSLWHRTLDINMYRRGRSRNCWVSAQSCHLLLNSNSCLLGTALFRLVSLAS
jgi:hypothetical protein